MCAFSHHSQQGALCSSDEISLKESQGSRHRVSQRRVGFVRQMGKVFVYSVGQTVFFVKVSLVKLNIYLCKPS